MSDQMIDILGKLIAAVFVSLMAYFTPKIKRWLETHTNKTNQQQIEALVKSFVQAAEQLLHNDDPDGTKRMQYVKNELNALGVEINKEIIGMIEGQVWEVNNKNKAAKNGNS